MQTTLLKLTKNTSSLEQVLEIRMLITEQKQLVLKKKKNERDK